MFPLIFQSGRLLLKSDISLVCTCCKSAAKICRLKNSNKNMPTEKQPAFVSYLFTTT